MVLYTIQYRLVLEGGMTGGLAAWSVLGSLLAQARTPSASDTWGTSVSSHSPTRQLIRSSDRADDDCDCDGFCKRSCDMARTARQNVTMYRVTPGNITDLPNRYAAAAGRNGTRERRRNNPSA